MELSKEDNEGEGRWVTLDNGQKLFIREGETFNEAVGRLNPSVKEPIKNIKYSIKHNGTKVIVIAESKHSGDSTFENLRKENGEVIGNSHYVKMITDNQKKHMLLLSVRGSKHYKTSYKGAGTILVSRTIQSSFDAGFNGRVELVSGPKATKFYDKLGFTKIGDDKSYMIEGEKAKKLLRLVKSHYGL